MSRFKQGQVITLKSDKSITGAIVNIMEGYPETRYQVFTAAGMQTYYESQIDIQESDEEMEKVNAERFNSPCRACRWEEIQLAIFRGDIWVID